MAPLVQKPNCAQNVVGALDGGHPPDPADGESIRRRCRARRGARRPARRPPCARRARCRAARPQSCDGRRDADRDELVAHLGADGDRGHRSRARGRARSSRYASLLRRAEVALERVAVERVDDDRGARRARRGGRPPADRAGLGGVRVEHVRALLSDQPREVTDGRRIARAARPRAAAPGIDSTSIPRCSATKAIDASPSEISPAASVVDVAARREALGEIGDVERRAAHVEAGDHAQHANRFVGSEHGRLRYRPLRADVHCCGAAEGIVLGVAGGARVDARRLSGGGGARRPGADAARAEGRRRRSRR